MTHNHADKFAKLGQNKHKTSYSYGSATAWMIFHLSSHLSAF